MTDAVHAAMARARVRLADLVKTADAILDDSPAARPARAKASAAVQAFAASPPGRAAIANLRGRLARAEARLRG